MTGLLPFILFSSSVWATVVFKPELGIGADYTNQRYATFNYDTLLLGDTTARDTLIRDTEGRTALGLNLNINSGPSRLTASNTFQLSTLSLRDMLNLSAEQRVTARLRLQAGYDGEVRYYHHALPQLADTNYRRDYWNHSGRVALKYEPTDNLGITLGNDLEYLHYPEADDYNYDYLVNRTRIAAWYDPNDWATVDVEYNWRRRWVTQVDSQDYHDHILRLGYDGYYGTNWHLRVDNDLGRRSYLSPLRSYWEERPSFLLGCDLSDRFAAQLGISAQVSWYDSTSPVYVNQRQADIRLLGEIKPSWTFSVRAGPQIVNSVSVPEHRSDDYRELAAVAELEYLKPGTVTVMLSDRLGRRNYPWQDTVDTEYLNNPTDYLFNELTGSINWTLLKLSAGALSLNSLVNLAPEWHTEPGDNVALSTFTIELKYSF